ncbi:MAG: PaaI family thioesterase [Desulfotalea sp.]
MELKVKFEQYISRDCFVCGYSNNAGLHARFFILENNYMVALFKPLSEHQSYPGRLHGGISSTILDEAIGRAIMQEEDSDIWGVTMQSSVRFRKPVPLDEPIMVVCCIDKTSRRTFEGRGVLLLADGTVAVEGKGKYMNMPLAKIAEMDSTSEDEWCCVKDEKRYFSFPIPENLFQ